MKALSGLGSAGSVLAAFGCPACLPALGALVSALGISFTAGKTTLLIITAALLLSGLAGFYINKRKHKKHKYFFIALIVTAFIGIASYQQLPEYTFYSGAGVLLLTAFFDYKEVKKQNCCNVKRK